MVQYIQWMVIQNAARYGFIASEGEPIFLYVDMGHWLSPYHYGFNNGEALGINFLPIKWECKQ
jgi:hypothetical protein